MGSEDAFRGGRRPTIYDVAELAGVSKSTVSRVVRGDTRVSEHTRDAVHQAIDSLHFVPTAAAQRLRSAGETSIGLLIRNIWTASYAMLNAQLQERLRALGFHVVQEAIVGAHPVNEEELLENIVALKVRAVIVASGTFPSEILQRYAHIVPLVVVGRPEVQPTLNNVAYDQVYHGQLIADYLYDNGHRSILVETLPAEFSMGSHARCEATIERANQLGMTVTTYDVSRQVDYRMVADLIASGEGPTAVSTIYDEFALNLWRALTSMGLRVPTDVSIIGADGLMEGIDLLGLTSIRLPVERLAAETTHLITQLVHFDKPPQQPARTSVRGWLLQGSTVRRLESHQSLDI